jgi:hypothetical protein
MSKKNGHVKPAEKVAAYLRAHDAGKRNYAKADRLLKEIAEEAGVGVDIPLGENGKKAVVVDRFKDKDLVFQPAAARRYELKVTP